MGAGDRILSAPDSAPDPFKSHRPGWPPPRLQDSNYPTISALKFTAGWWFMLIAGVPIGGVDWQGLAAQR